jgi:Chondroitin N-acetylgalactosaminyltransferase
MIKFCVTVYNRLENTVNFLNDLKAIYENDTNFSLILLDYNSTDLDVASYLKDMPFQYTLIQKNQPFVFDFTSCAALASPDDILVLCCVDVRLPTNFLDKIRKYVKQGKEFYAPITALEKADGTLESGEDIAGGPLTSMYRSDYDKSPFPVASQWGEKRCEISIMEGLEHAGLKMNRPYESQIISSFHVRDFSLPWYKHSSIAYGQINGAFWWRGGAVNIPPVEERPK